jgi:hypothetical protein
MPERSKGLDSSSSIFVCVGSNPTECSLFAFLLLFDNECMHGLTFQFFKSSAIRHVGYSNNPIKPLCDHYICGGTELRLPQIILYVLPTCECIDNYVLHSQNRTVPSLRLIDANNMPSGEYWTSITGPACPNKVG